MLLKIRILKIAFKYKNYPKKLFTLQNFWRKISSSKIIFTWDFYMKNHNLYKAKFAFTTLLILANIHNSHNANADSNINFYGILDYGIAYKTNYNFQANNSTNSTHNSKHNFAINSNQRNGSRLGIKANEIINNNLSLFFTLERGLYLDTGKDFAGFNRQSLLGLNINKKHNIYGGLVYTPYYNIIYQFDPFEDGTIGNYRNLKGDYLRIADANLPLNNDLRNVRNPVRANNALYYSFQNKTDYFDYNFDVLYTNKLLNKTDYENSNYKLFNFALMLKQDNKYKVAFSYFLSKSNGYKSEKINQQTKLKLENYTLGFNYNITENLILNSYFSLDKIHFPYLQIQQKNTILIKNALLGFTLKTNNFGVFKLSYQNSFTNNKNIKNTQQFAIGNDYYINKRFLIYSAFSYIKNNDNRFATISDALNSGNNYQKAFQTGITYFF